MKRAVTVLGIAILAGGYPLSQAKAQVADATPPQSQSSGSLTQSVENLGATLLRGQSITLGLGYAQGSFKLPLSTLTDNGAAEYIFEYDSTEKALLQWHMATGSGLLGLNLTGTLGHFRTDYQLVSSAVTGTDIGTGVSGNYLAGAPMLFVRFGPLYSGSEIYWKFGAGLGVGLMRYSGTAAVDVSAPNPPVIEPESSQGTRLAEYIPVDWELQINHWNLIFTSKYFYVRSSPSATYELYGLGLAYRFDF